VRFEKEFRDPAGTIYVFNFLTLICTGVIMETRTETSNRPTTTTNTLLSSTDTNRQQPSSVKPQGDGANGVIQQAKETLNQGVEKVSQSTGQIYDSAIQFSKKNPGKAIGIALASGATLGFLLGRTSKHRYDDSLWGAVTSAALRAAINRWS
jgi:ElaB/YqjD/DUF883 family membrane-anchored ribosome-binding protein